jgi:septum formation protein
MTQITLASASPRRRDLMDLLGVEFRVVPSLVDEEAVDLPRVHPGAFVRALAMLKAEEVAERMAERMKEGLVLGADTVVVLEEEIIGKPRDVTDAARMLNALKGRTHQVFTGLALIHMENGVAVGQLEDHVETDVRMRNFSSDTLHAYLDTGEPLDKAGAYGIQGRGAILVEGITGDFYNVMGLPLARLSEMLERFGVRCL